MIKGNYNILTALALSGLVHVFIVYSQQSKIQTAEESIFQVELISESIETTGLSVESQKQEPLIEKKQALHLEVIHPVPVIAMERVEQRQKKNHVLNKKLAAVIDGPVEQDLQKTSQQPMRDSIHNPKTAKVLSGYVYAAINRNKRYPYMARRQRMQGQVKLKFVLHPDGQITDINIIETSRYALLDKAAMQAVNDISPFTLASEYLSSQHQYNVDIVFRIN